MLLGFGLLLLVAVVSFLLGSIPWGVVISKLAYHKDLRDEGSGNIGTTNAMRALGKRGGSSVFALDFGKGLLSGFIGYIVGSYLAEDLVGTGLPAMVPVLVGFGFDKMEAVRLAVPYAHEISVSLALLACVVGHIYSPWLHFKGGKGVAVAVGALFLVFGPLLTFLEIAVFAVLVVTTRYVSVGSIAAAVLCPFIALYVFWGDWVAVGMCWVAAFLVIWAHRGNIKRLAAGEENRIGAKKQ